MVGLTYFGPIIGVFVGSFISGVLADKLVLRLARRNKRNLVIRAPPVVLSRACYCGKSYRSSRSSIVLDLVMSYCSSY